MIGEGANGRAAGVSIGGVGPQATWGRKCSKSRRHPWKVGPLGGVPSRRSRSSTPRLPAGRRRSLAADRSFRPARVRGALFTSSRENRESSNMYCRGLGDTAMELFLLRAGVYSRLMVAFSAHPNHNAVESNRDLQAGIFVLEIGSFIGAMPGGWPGAERQRRRRNRPGQPTRFLWARATRVTCQRIH